MLMTPFDTIHLMLVTLMLMLLVSTIFYYSKMKGLKRGADSVESRLSAQMEHTSTVEHELVVLRDQLSVQTVLLAERDKLLDQWRAQCEREKQRGDEAQREAHEKSVALAELRASLKASEANNEALNEQFERQKAALSEQFQLLANEILEKKSKIMQQQGKEGLATVLDPFRKTLAEFKQEVQDIHHRETIQQGALRKELGALKELNQQITQEAHQLSTALKGQKKLQGNWGELILENVLERSGLRLNVDFKREVTLATEEGKFRPDVVVYLPQDKHIVIDAKVSLNAYLRYVNADDEVERAAALQAHVQAVMLRVKELGEKAYHRLPGLNSPEIVFMFMPIESAFVEALKADERLFQQALNSNILIATPTTLLTSLNIVRQLWRFEEHNKHTLTLANKAESIFKKLNLFLGSFESIKKGIDKASDAYLKAENQLLHGRGNLVKQVNEFKKLAPAIQGELPTHFVERAEWELQTQEEVNESLATESQD